MKAFGSVLRTYLWLLPVSAVVTFYALFAAPFTADDPAALAHARYGWPLPWIEQDLSRYEPIGYPTTIAFDGVRAWDDPIDTNYDLLAAVADVLIIGVGVTGLFLVAMIPIRRAIENRPRIEAH
ncbi:hypothetical protein ACWGJP_06070 [Microbacterium sp. NPDC055903]